MSIVASNNIKKHYNDSWNFLLESTSEILEELNEFHDDIQIKKEEEVNEPYIAKEEQEQEQEDHSIAQLNS